MRPAKKRELLEWMGMTRADFCVYFAFTAAAALFVVRTPVIDLAIAFVAIALAITSCFWGMKSEPEFEDITNLFKLVSYPAALLIVLLVTGAHYALVLSGNADYAGYGVSRAAERIDHFFQDAPGYF